MSGESKETTEADRNRLKAILEMVESERAYVKDLRTIIEVFMDPLCAMFKDDERVTTILFGNVKEIERANKELCAKLEKMVGQFAQEERSVLFYVATIFIEMAPKMVVYDRYCKNYERAIELYQQMVENPAFNTAVEAQRIKWNLRVGGLLLSDFLIKPVQRICKYPLLFKALIGYTAEDHSDLPLLKKADAAMQKAAEEVNKARQDQKSAQDMKYVDENMEGYTGGSLLIPGRYLLRAGPLVKLSPSGGHQERHFFLFTDMILYAKKNKKTYEYKDHIELTELSVRAVEKTHTAKGLGAKEVDQAFELTRQDNKKKKVYTIVAESQTLRNAWISSLQEAIQTANRRKQTVGDDAIAQLESRMKKGTGGTDTSSGSGRTFSLFSTSRGKTPRGATLTSEDAPDASTLNGSGEVAILNAVKSVRQQVADTNKLLSQAKDLHAKLTEKVDAMSRMVELEEKARLELQKRIEQLEGHAGMGGLLSPKAKSGSPPGGAADFPVVSSSVESADSGPTAATGKEHFRDSSEDSGEDDSKEQSMPQLPPVTSAASLIARTSTSSSAAASTATTATSSSSLPSASQPPVQAPAKPLPRREAPKSPLPVPKPRGTPTAPLDADAAPQSSSPVKRPTVSPRPPPKSVAPRPLAPPRKALPVATDDVEDQATPPLARSLQLTDISIPDEDDEM